MPVAGPSFPVTTRIKSSSKLPAEDSYRHQTQQALGSLCLLGLWCQFFMDLNGVIHVPGLHLNEPRQSNLQNRQGWNVNTPNPNKNQKMVVCSKTRELTWLKREKGKRAHITLILEGAMSAAAVQSLKLMFEMKQVWGTTAQVLRK